MTRYIACLALLFCSLAALAQQSGTIMGTVTDGSGQSLPGAVVRAESARLPQARTVVTTGTGSYRLSLLPPGDVRLTVSLPGFNTAKRSVFLGLEQTARVNISLTLSTQEETLRVSAQSPLVDVTSAEQSFTGRSQMFEKIPLGQDYKDLVRLAPGIQVTEMSVRGPSAGGNGQDNVYKFDGVDVTLPLFGTLAARPSSHDIAQFTVTRGGAKATNFNRSGGFLINSVSKSGTNEFRGELEYVYRNHRWAADSKTPKSSLDGEAAQRWASVNYGGPLLRERLFFFASYYAPERKTSKISNNYGNHPDSKDETEELFAKLTYAPLANLTLHGSFRSNQSDEASMPDAFTDVGLGSVSESDLKLTVLEGDWILSNNHSLSFNFTRMKLNTAGTPNGRTDAVPSREIGSTIDLSNLHNLGALRLPTLGSSEERNALYQPYIDRYGYLDENGVRRGGGTTGIATQFDRNDFGRTAFQMGWDWLFISAGMEHNIHVGFRHTEEEEDLNRDQQGYGSITFPTSGDALIRSEFIQSNGTDPIHSEYHSSNIEINDNITWGKWSFNLGLLLSHDELYGQDLTEDPSTPSGYRVSVGSKYLMYDIDWEDMIQPRLGVVRELRDNETVYANYAVYNPMASSLPRAASWARNRRNLVVRNFYDANGVLLSTENRGSSSGKFFQPDMDPREIQEYLVGYNRQMDNGWTYRLSSRYRYGSNFWEDTNNNARTAFYVTAPEDQQQEILERGLYIPDLNLYRFGEEGEDNGVGGSSYVIAELDGAFTRYYEVSGDVERQGENYYLKGSYTWSHYYGNFDQDNTTTNNDGNIFLGSSNLADGVGRQLWDFKEGDLKGDRRHILKFYGSYDFKWNGTLGALAFWQSGEAWETSDVAYYSEYTASSSSTNRFSEPAGSRTGPSHYQIDLNYQHNFKFARVRLATYLDVFNILDRQSDYNIDSTASSVNYGVGRDFFAPRRYQLGLKLDF